MNVPLRRLATLLLLLAVPLRVYAAVAMLFCGQPAETTPVASGTHPVQHAHMQMPTLESPHAVHADEETMDDPVGESGIGPAGTPDHLSCSACCCTGMIATAQHDWKPQVFATPSTPAFTAIAVPSTDPHRFERPPRSLPA